MQDLVFDHLVIKVTDIMKRHPRNYIFLVPSYYRAAFERNVWPLPCAIWFGVFDKFQIVHPGTIVQQQ